MVPLVAREEKANSRNEGYEGKESPSYSTPSKMRVGALGSSPLTRRFLKVLWWPGG